MDVTSISASITALRAAKDIAQGIFNLKSAIEIQGKVIELQSEILNAQEKALDAQSEQANLLHRIRELENQLTDLVSQKEAVSRLERREGMSYYPGDSEPYCARCAEVDIRLVHLAKSSRLEMGKRVFRCPQCKSEWFVWPEST